MHDRESADGLDFVVTLHGVGGPKPGATLRGLAHYFERTREVSYAVTDRLTGGSTFRVLTPDSSRAPGLLEINWSDIRRPPESPLAELWHVPKLLIGMLHLADRWDGHPERRHLYLIGYKWLIELSVWMVPYIVYVMLLASVPASARLATVLLFSAGVLGLALSVRSWSRMLAVSGVLFSLVYLAIGLRAHASDDALQSLVASASRGYVLRHQTFPLMIYLLFGLMLFTDRKRLNVEQRLVRFLLAYLPFLGIAIAGSLLWVVTVPLVGETPGYRAWSETHARILSQHGYDLRLAEYAHMAGIVLLGGTALGAAAIYALRALTGWRRATSGEFCRNAIPRLAALVPVALIPVTGAIVYARFFETTPPQVDVLEVYRVSALRIVPFLPWLFTPMRIVVDICGDVVFTALPDDEPLGIAERVLARTRSAIDYVSRKGGRVVVLSHSLGTVIASHALERAPANLALVTTGSPLAALHRRFFGFESRTDRRLRGAGSWKNLYRADDYIGGPIADGPENAMQMQGGHTGYWNDETVLATVASVLDAPAIVAEGLAQET
jgi:hypothetical protein